jgi:metallo-beta-lactamase family protein
LLRAKARFYLQPSVFSLFIVNAHLSIDTLAMPANDATALRFLGATNTVTGSRYLVRTQGHAMLVDCGLFQGYKQLRLRNWAKPPFDAAAIKAVVLTHAHLDHSGYLPLLVKQGFHGKIYATPATFDLCKILLPDSGFLQEEQARFENRHKLSKHDPALPLYTKLDAERSLEFFETKSLGETFEPMPGVRVEFSRAGHVLGAASVRVQTSNTSILFSGDLGRPNDPLMRAPEAPPAAEHLVIESTYGDRLHPAEDMRVALAEALSRAIARGGVVVAPSFAVGRAQLLMLLIAELKAQHRLPDVPVYLDSPMAIDATELYLKYSAEHRLSPEECQAMCRSVQLVHTSEQSKALDQRREPMIIISASGMATGGRVVHHLKVFAPDPRNLILLPGFQAGGTRGAALAAGAETVRIHGQDVPVRAEVVKLETMSAHADANELIAWARQMPSPPRTTFVTHGEPAASDTLRARFERELGWPAVVPDFRDEFDL